MNYAKPPFLPVVKRQHKPALCCEHTWHPTLAHTEEGPIEICIAEDCQAFCVRDSEGKIIDYDLGVMQ